MGSAVAIFEQALVGDGWIYPCSVEDIRRRLAAVPESDLEGLRAIGLVPATRKDCGANGRYFFERAAIHLYSHPASLSFKLRRGTRLANIERGWSVELGYGMRPVPAGSRWLTFWTRDDLRRFIVEHVLVHEIGHHVYHRGRMRQGLVFRPRTREAEQFAEAYALRFDLRLCGPRRQDAPGRTSNC